MNGRSASARFETLENALAYLRMFESGFLPFALSGLSRIASQQSSTRYVGSIMDDPLLSLEDKICILSGTILDRLTADIERQAHKISALQTMQRRRTVLGSSTSPSIDTMVLAMKRLLDKRAEMVGIFGGIVKSYVQTWKNITDTIGR